MITLDGLTSPLWLSVIVTAERKEYLGLLFGKKYVSILQAKQRKQILPHRKLSEANLVRYSLLMMISFLHRRELHLQIVVILHGAVDGLPQQLVLFLHSIHLGLQHAQLYIYTNNNEQLIKVK